MEPARTHVWTSQIVVRWGDMDYYGHVNNTQYFRYFEQARVEWIEHLGYPVGPEQPEGAVIIHADCTFLLPVMYPATVEVKVYVGEPGRSSVMTWYEMRLVGDERIHAQGSAKVVWMDNATGKSAPLPEGLRHRIVTMQLPPQGA